MIRIAHLSDIHLNQATLDAADDFVVKALVRDLKSYNDQKQIDLVVFTGDLLDKGGSSFGSIEIGFICFEDKVLEPISDALSLPKHRFFFAPGNHDVDRTADGSVEDAGLCKILDCTEKGDIGDAREILTFVGLKLNVSPSAVSKAADRGRMYSLAKQIENDIFDFN